MVQGVLSGTLPLRSGLNLDAADGPHYMQLAATLHPCKVLKNVTSCKPGEICRQLEFKQHTRCRRSLEWPDIQGSPKRMLYSYEH